jgi:hypothetical protein
VEDKVILDHLQGRHVVGVYPLALMSKKRLRGYRAIGYDRDSGSGRQRHH